MTRVALILIVVLATALAGTAAPAPSAHQIRKHEIAAIVAPFVDAHSPGFAVFVRSNGENIFERGYGVRELGKPAKIDSQTNFRLASCSKQFTAMAIMLLVHDGKLRYDETVNEIFSDFPAYGKTITIRDLLNHTSGLLDYEVLMDEQERKIGKHWSDKKQIQDSEVYELLKQTDKTEFVPGTKWAYSNSGYVLLGLIVARVSRKSFPEYLQERIFSPLKMEHTLAFVKGKKQIANRAFGHSKINSEWAETDQSSTSATLGDGGIYSNIADLAKWDAALANHTLLSAAEMQPALTPFKISDASQIVLPDDATDAMKQNPSIAYGFGWFLDPYKNHERTWHYGDTMGFHTYIVRFTEDNLSVIVLCNRTDVSPETLALKIADLFLNNKN